MKSTNRESIRLRDVARSYKERGYHVYLDPRGAGLPRFLRGVRPDLLAMKSDDKVVVEVKTRRTLPHDKNLREIARLVESRPGWRFEMVLTNPRSAGSRPISGSSLTHAEIKRRLASSQVLAKRRDYQSAVLLLWTVIEVLLRAAADRGGLTGQAVLAPQRLLKELRTRGFLTSRQYPRLRHALETRNRVVHGFTVPGLRSQAYRDLLKLAKELMKEQST